MDELLEGISATAFLLRFTITNPAVHTTIVGTLNPAHLHANVAAVLQGPLPAAVYTAAKRRLAAARAILTSA
jgi:aryl-alcohol dehydrogenase-like predicted oxidoreductase